MLVIGKYNRHGKMPPAKQIEKGYHTRYVYLFYPVYGLGRDHCRMEGKRLSNMKRGRYLIWGKHQRYICSNGYEKASVIPHGKFGLKISQKIYHWYRRKIHKPIRIFYNIYIKNNVYRYCKNRKTVGVYN